MQLRVLTGGRLVAKVAAALALVFGAAPATTVAQETRTAYAAMVFSAEGRPVPTTACLEVIERVYPSTPWWEAAVAEGSSAERAFKAVIGAIKRKSRAALLEVTDPAQAKDTAEFDRQASAFFAQLQTIPLLAVPRAYEFDGLLVFFGTLKFLSETAIVPFVFAHQGNDRFGFLPSRTKGLTFRLVEDWFTGTAAPGKEAPAYCDEAAVKRATHRVSLVGASWRPSTLLLTGAPLAEPGALSGVAARVKSTVDAMKAALRGPDVSALAAHLTAFGADRLKRWLETAPAAEIEGYKTALIEQQPFFVFDASPLIVVYTKTKAGQNQVMYFTPAADQRLLWTNSSYLTVIDQVFKQGRLMAAAGGEPPFSELARK